MKNRILFVLFLMVSFGIVSCQKEDSSNPSSDRDKFLATWKVSANGSYTKQLNWEMTIRAGSSSPDQILIDNFDQHKETTIGSVNGNNFSISTQQVGSDTLQGSGTYSSGKLTFHYTSTDGIQPDDVYATAEKK